jgi:exodeoxyribonuclease VII small subunit
VGRTSTWGSPTAPSERPLTEPSFEDAQRELEQIVERLEQGKAPLDEAIALWERGEELYRLCVAKLDSAQGKIEELASRVEAAQPTS